MDRLAQLHDDIKPFLDEAGMEMTVNHSTRPHLEVNTFGQSKIRIEESVLTVGLFYINYPRAAGCGTIFPTLDHDDVVSIVKIATRAGIRNK